MTIRNTPFTAALAALFAAPGLAAQDHKLPDSLAYIGLPANPSDMPRVARNDMVTPAFYLFKAGCPQ